VAENLSCGTRREFKYRELKTFGEPLVGGTKIACAFKTVDNSGMIPTTERVSNICQVSIQQFT
jgi:hypothetical protein